MIVSYLFYTSVRDELTTVRPTTAHKNLTIQIFQTMANTPHDNESKSNCMYDLDFMRKLFYDT